MQIVFGVYCRSETVYTPKLVDPKSCEIESSSSVRCIVADQHQLYDLPTNPETLLIIEV